jgi:uncharacterized membrane protein
MTLRKLTFSAQMAHASAASLFGLCLLSPNVASAELKLCNTTSSRIGVAIGYKDKDGWTSEGWWNVNSQSCEVLIQDKLRARFYYIYAFDYDRGGEWGGPVPTSIPMCTKDAEFTIRGIENCEGRGFNKTGFFEVDTQEQTDWTVRLTDPEPAQPALENATSTTAPPPGGPAQAAAAPAPGTKRR